MQTSLYEQTCKLFERFSREKPLIRLQRVLKRMLALLNWNPDLCIKSN